MESEFVPTPEPRGDLVPPPRKPPTAAGSDLPAPAPFRGPIRSGAEYRAAIEWPKAVNRAIEKTFDALDAVADTIAEVTRLRPSSGR
jgi:hypothetical protein